jgi:hypothetical protein
VIYKNNNVFTNENNTNNLNIEYISGLFDAEGCLFINKKCKKYYISITQSKYPYILYKIKDFLNFGVIDKENKYKIYSKENCLKFIEYTKKYLIVKSTFVNTIYSCPSHPAALCDDRLPISYIVTSS